MENVILAIDCSGSTGGRKNYWDKSLEIYEKLCTTYGSENVKILFWDDRLEKNVSSLSFLSRVKSCRGGGGTEPYVIASAEILPENSNVVIITDGEVNVSSVEKCDNIVKGRPFKNVTVWFINNGGNMNLSVSTPFTRNCENVTINVRDSQNDNVLMKGNTRNELSIQKYYDNPELFLSELQAITGVIMLQNIGKTNILLRNSLLDLQKNLLTTLAKRKSENKATWNSLEETLLSDNLDSYNQAVELCRQLIGPVEDNSPAKQIEAAIAHLVKLCTDNKDYSFRNLQSQRVLRAENVANVNVAEMPKANIVDGIYECPVALDNDLPTLPINRGDGVLSHLDAKYQDYLVSMPLATLENPQLVTAIRNRFGKVIGHGSLCELYKRDRVPQDPQTRMPIVSVLIPHLPNDERERKIYSKSIDHALASILFGNKLVGQPGLWLAVIWQCIKSTPYLSEDAPFMSVFESFLVSYWRTYSTRITLTGLVVEPMINTSISLAMWYCLSSFDINFSANSKMDDERNRLRALGPVARHFIPCIELLKYSYDKDFIQRQIGIYQAFAWMMDQEKTPDSNWRNMIRACWQNSVILENGNIILLDGPPRKDAKLPEEISHLSLGTVISLMNLVDKTKKTSEIFISRKLEESPIPSFVTNYGYPELTEEVLMKKIPICSQTCRPYYVDRKIKKKWDDCAKCYGPLDKQCHNYRLFIDFVFGKDRYPQSVSEFILYASEKQANRLVNPVDTLPLYEPIFVKNMFLDYEEVLGKDFKDVSVKDFKTRVWKSMNEKERASIDGSVQFI